MRTAIVSLHASPLAGEHVTAVGGQNIHVSEISSALARRGHDVTVFTRRNDTGRPRRVLTPAGYAVVHLDAGPAQKLSEPELFEHVGGFGRILAAEWADQVPDVAHAYSWTSGIATLLAARESGIPTVQTFRELDAVKQRHQGRGRNGPNARAKLEKLVARHASWIAAGCTEELSEVMRLGRPRAQMSVVPCGVDVTTFSADGPSAERGARPRIVAVGELQPHSGFDATIIALSGIPDAELVIVGGADDTLADTAEVRRLCAVAGELGVADRVVFTGPVPHDEMPKILRSADVVMVTPWYGGTGMVALEAMACGVPVIASDVGGMRDAVVDDVTGRLVPPRNPRAIAEAASEILHDSFRRRGLGLAGRDRACARYSWDSVARATLRIYDDLISARHNDRPIPIVTGHPTVQGSLWN